ncbi:hypothetical protein AB0C84_12260 [Actinomadura sp. NPDC048955]
MNNPLLLALAGPCAQAAVQVVGAVCRMWKARARMARNQARSP